MNAFNEKTLSDDMRMPDATGLMETCDKCTCLIFNWRCIGDCAFLSMDGVRILCRYCWNDEKNQLDLIDKYKKSVIL